MHGRARPRVSKLTVNVIDDLLIVAFGCPVVCVDAPVVIRDNLAVVLFCFTVIPVNCALNFLFGLALGSRELLTERTFVELLRHLTSCHLVLT